MKPLSELFGGADGKQINIPDSRIGRFCVLQINFCYLVRVATAYILGIAKLDRELAGKTRYSALDITTHFHDSLLVVAKATKSRPIRNVVSMLIMILTYILRTTRHL